MSKFLTERENLESLLDQMDATAAAEFNKFGHLRLEGAFEDRVFVIYQPRGKRNGKKNLVDQKEPHVISTVRVIGITADIRNGARVRLFDEASGTEMSVGYVPKRLFNYEIYIALPSAMSLNLGGQVKDGEVKHSFTFGLLIKTRNRSDFYSTVNTYMETPNKFLELFPAVTNEFLF